MITITQKMAECQYSNPYPTGWEALQNTPFEYRIIDPSKPNLYVDMILIHRNLLMIADDLWKKADGLMDYHPPEYKYREIVLLQDLALIIEHVSGLLYDKVNQEYYRRAGL